MQRSFDVGHPQGTHIAGPIARMLLRLGTATVLEHGRAGWSDLCRRYVKRNRPRGNASAFLMFLVRELADLLDGAGWDNEYPRDTWQLHRLGLISATATRSLHFDDINQAWLSGVTTESAAAPSGGCTGGSRGGEVDQHRDRGTCWRCGACRRSSPRRDKDSTPSGS